ncbi:hypothetical protein [Shewanella chilikensis]|uniref:hypothetical protein n=1 Tax=Shewanella chilikensis TaxID=558541 RepID=UPI003A976CC3
MAKRKSNKKVKESMFDVAKIAGKHKTKMKVDESGFNPVYWYECLCGHVSKKLTASIFSPLYCHQNVTFWMMKHEAYSHGVVSLTTNQIKGIE